MVWLLGLKVGDKIDAFKKDDRYNLSMWNVAIIEHINKCEVEESDPNFMLVVERTC